MYLGELVETGPAERVFRPPFHPYTQSLIAAVPRLGGEKPVRPVSLDTPSPALPNVPQAAHSIPGALGRMIHAGPRLRLGAMRERDT